MHAKIVFTSDFEDESLIIILKGNQWWPTYDQESSEAEKIITEMKGSVKESDIPLFLESKKFVLLSTRDSRSRLAQINLLSRWNGRFRRGQSRLASQRHRT